MDQGTNLNATLQPLVGARQAGSRSSVDGVPAPDALYLPDDVFLCVTEGHGVFLDLKRDKYSAIVFPSEQEAPGATAALAPSHDALVRKLRPQRDALLAAGLLSTTAGQVLAAAPIEGVAGHIFGLGDQRAFGLSGEAGERVRTSLADLFDFFVASWKASHDLKRKHISRIVGNVRRRKARGGLHPVHAGELRRLTAIYRRLRPWYARKYLCLYDSLALVEFLARRGVYPLWVFAVQAQPFGAHCWVQSDRLLLNEGTEYAGQFTPIMAI